MFGTRPHRVAAVVAAAALGLAATPAVAQEGGTGDLYSDLVIALRDDDGVPELVGFPVEEPTEYCVQPISYTEIPGVASTTNLADGRTVWPVPLVGELGALAAPTAPGDDDDDELEVCDPQAEYAIYVSEVELERLNLVRAPDSVIAKKLEDLQARLEAADTVALDAAGRITTDITDDVDDAGDPIPPATVDASPDQAAIFYSIMTTGQIPGLGSSPAALGGFDAWDLAAVGVGAAASKPAPINIDTIEYYGRISSVIEDYDPIAPWEVNFLDSDPPGDEQFIDFEAFEYDRADVFKGCATWLDVPELTWKVSNLLDLVDFRQIGASAPGSENVAGFAQLADDVRATILWLHENEGVEGYFQADPVFEETCEAQREIVKDITAGDDITPPTLTWLTVPDDITDSTDATFSFSVDDAITVLCTLDAGEPEPCSSPKDYTSLSSGDHTFTVTAVDASNNWASIQHEWTILIPGELISSSTPIRLVDTREPWVAADARFTATGPVAGGTMIEVPIAGRGTIPIGAQAAVLNVTVDGATAPGFLTVFPCGPMPLASSLNYASDHPVANELITKLSPNGTVCIYALTTTHVIVDAVGHVPADSAYEPVAPSRLADTRQPWVAADAEFTATGPVAGGTMIEVPIAGRGGIDADAEAAVLNVTVDGATAMGFLTVFPCGDMPLASSLNYASDHPVANELITKLSPNGTVCIYALTTTHVIVDAVGSM